MAYDIIGDLRVNDTYWGSFDRLFRGYQTPFMFCKRGDNFPGYGGGIALSLSGSRVTEIPHSMAD